jgi:nitroimidazol reductase NimA-like FMN-containing flavoprotein (pyridoxamine 5'-phosphate oxidase superfamily)
MTTGTFERTKRNRVVRMPERGHYDRESVYGIIDEALLCHVGFAQEGQPFVIPTLHARLGDRLLLHGATTSRMLKHLQAGNPVCVTMTIADGLVLARSVFHHSINYRSVVLFGQGTLITDPDEKMSALAAFTDRLMPGRWDDAREPNRKEFKATSVVAIPIDSASAKVRVGPPKDDEEDLGLPVWAGVVPIRQVVDVPQPAPDLRDGVAVPGYIEEYVAQRR